MTARRPDRVRQLQREKRELGSPAGPTRHLFGLPFLDAESIAAVAAHVFEDSVASTDAWRTVVTPNVDHLVRYAKRPDEESVARSAQWVLSDGMPIVWASRLLGAPLARRLAGSDLFRELWSLIVETRSSVLLVVGNDDVATRLAAEHPTARCIVPTFFDVDDDDAVVSLVEEIVDEVTATPTRFVMLGLSMPKHHRVGALLRERTAPPGGAPILLLLGASAEFYVGVQRRAPTWMQKSGTEWVHRLLSNPRTMAKRYLYDDLLFVPLVWREWRRRRR